jgi:hypothetical protein
MQLHLLLSLSAGEKVDKVGLVWSSRLRIAESKSESAVLAPCIAVPPEMLIFAFGAGEAVREDCVDAPFFFGANESEINGPEADGGAFEVIG